MTPGALAWAMIMNESMSRETDWIAVRSPWANSLEDADQ